MHTLILTLTGLILLFIFIFVAASIYKHKNVRAVNGARMFIWFWLAVSIINLCIGVFVAGVSMRIELGVLLIIFGLPAIVAWYVSRKFPPRNRATNDAL
jgi:hypothetical protein